MTTLANRSKQIGFMNGPVLRGDLLDFLEEAQGVESMLIAQRILPPYGVPLQSGQYLKLRIGRAELLSATVSRHAPGAAFPRSTRTYESDTYDCIPYGDEELVPFESEQETSRFGLEQLGEAAKLIMRKHLLAHELRTASAIFNPTTFTATTSTIAYTVANLASVDFVGADFLPLTVRLMLKGYNPKEATVVMSRAVYNYIRRSANAQAFFRGNRPNDSIILYGEGQLSDLLGVKEVLVGDAGYNTAGKSNAGPGPGPSYISTLVPIWSNSYIWVGITKSGNFTAGGAGRTVYWDKYGGLFIPETYPEWSRDSTVVRVKAYMIEKIVDTVCAELIITQYA